MVKYNEREILSNYLENIKNKLQAGLFMLAENAILLKDKNNFEFSYPLPVELLNIERKTINIFKNLEDVLSSDINNRDQIINQALELNKDLIKIAESIYCYFSFNDLLQEIIIHFQRITLIANEKPVSIDIHSFYHDCLDFIHKDKQDFLVQNNISLLMKRLPLKMTKSKFEDYIEKSIRLLLKNSSVRFTDNIIETFKFKYLPSKMAAYGKYYPEIKDKLDTVFLYDYETMTYEQLKEAYTTLDDNIAILQGISDYLSRLHESVNFLVLIFTFSKDLNYLLEDDLIKKDVIYSVLENINDPDSPFDENLYDLINGTCEQYVDKIINFDNNKAFKLENIDTENLSEETIGVLKIHKIVTNGYYEKLSDIVFPLSVNEAYGDLASPLYVDEKIQEFLAFAKTSLEGIQPSIAKIIKRMFLDCVPSCFSEQEFSQYLQYILETTNDFIQKVFILDTIGALFEDTGYLDKIIDKEENLSHEHHHHSHDCGCGHHH